MRREFLESSLNRLLSRYSPPAHFKAHAQAEADEIGALFRAIDRAAPKDGYEGWWSNFRDALEQEIRTRAWPTVHEVSRVAKMVSERAKAEQPEDKTDREKATEMVAEYDRTGKAPRAAKDIHTEIAMKEFGRNGWDMRLDGWPFCKELTKWMEENQKVTRRYDDHHHSVLNSIRSYPGNTYAKPEAAE